MKKIMNSIILSVLILMTFILPNGVSALTPTLESIAETFNNSNTVNNYKNLLSWNLNASVDSNEPNILSVTITAGEEASTINCELDGNILSCDNLTDRGVITAAFLADSIGQLQGYSDGELFKNFNMFSDDIKEYTVDNEGFEINEIDNSYLVLMDITKKVPLIDESEFYLKPTEFDFIKQIIDDDSTGNQTGRNVKLAYDIVIGEDESYIYIGEVDELTNSAYKSILSALEVMYGTDVVEYFKSIYSGFDEGSILFDSFDIDVYYDIDVEEHPIFTDTKVVLVTVNNDYINDMFLRSEFIGETVNRGDKTITLDFTNDNSYKLGFFDRVNSSDAAFLFKYLLEPIFVDSGSELVDNTVYYNIVDGKIVVGDVENSIFKLVIKEDYLEILATNNNVFKTTIRANHQSVKSTEYEACDYGHDHHRYGEYNLTVDVTYGNRVNYEVIDRSSNSVDASSGEKLEFEFNIDFSKFIEDGQVYVDGKLIDPVNYTSREGSTIVTFNDNYIKTLSNGEHTLNIKVADGEATTTFKVLNNEVNNPKTGDNIVTVILLLSLSIITLFSSGLLLKNKIQFYPYD